MGRKLLKISYLGTAYCGWQVQNNGISVQYTLQNALEQIIGTRVGVTGCSRTDSGVHANEFCLHFNYDGNVQNKNIVSGVNSKLPDDIAVISCEDVSDDFHARYSTKGKNYIYKIYSAPTPNPFLHGRALYIKRPLDIDLMNKFCQTLVGKHDFTSFCASGSNVLDNTRTVYECKVYKNKDLTELSITADGFLYNMVRIIVGTAIDISDKKIDIKNAEYILNAKDRTNAGKTAPACGLYLNKVFY